MNATIFNSVNDLRDWVDPRVEWESTEERDAVIDAIRRDMNRPALGLDWSEYLDSLPDNLLDLLEDE